VPRELPELREFKERLETRAFKAQLVRKELQARKARSVHRVFRVL
jgi:hypothetical protein